MKIVEKAGGESGVSAPLLPLIKERVDAIAGRLVKFRREIHSRPELSGQEKDTSAFVAGVLEAADIEVRRGVGGYGVVGLLRGGAAEDGAPTVALRADMDALPVDDCKDVEYASSVPGVMHACGHDVHTAVLMGAAEVLASVRAHLRGNVKFLFQPSEERSFGGAGAMIEDGALEDPEVAAIVALHCFPEMEVGTIGHRPGIMTASADRVRITVKGRSGHASRPHQTVDAVLVASQVINAIHHIVSRRTNPLRPAVISIGTIYGGRAENIIADKVVMEGTIRTLDGSLREQVPRFIEEVLEGVTTCMGAGYDMEIIKGNPSVRNDERLDSLVARCAADVLGVGGVRRMADPMMGAEDFSLFAERVPGVLFRLGTGNSERGITSPLHSSTFDVDEDAIAIGAKIMSWIAASYLERRPHGAGPARAER
ncbi:MAG TPA: amidohydrolase [Deltaproteobacteria bacterium]|nr:amidohydrolase [Deltaproteobacteria bacterium]